MERSTAILVALIGFLAALMVIGVRAGTSMGNARLPAERAECLQYGRHCYRTRLSDNQGEI